MVPTLYWTMLRRRLSLPFASNMIIERHLLDTIRTSRLDGSWIHLEIYARDPGRSTKFLTAPAVRYRESSTQHSGLWMIGEYSTAIIWRGRAILTHCTQISAALNEESIEATSMVTLRRLLACIVSEPKHHFTEPHSGVSAPPSSISLRMSYPRCIDKLSFGFDGRFSLMPVFALPVVRIPVLLG